MTPIHPGEILLEDFMKPLGISTSDLARTLLVPRNRIRRVVDGSRPISADTALRLAQYFGTSAELWIGLQIDHDLEVTRRKLGRRLDSIERISA